MTNDAAHAPENRILCRMLRKRTLELVLWGATCFLSASSCAKSPGDPSHANASQARHLILVSLDTVRADHLGCYGSKGAQTPRLDDLAESGIRFGSVMSAAPTTLASHASILTGTYPQNHGVPRNGFQLNPANITLAEILAHEGFATLAAVGAFPLAAAFGLDQGFQRYDDELGSASQDADYAERDAASVTDAALALVDASRAGAEDRRLFLFAHYFDAHAPYLPPAPFDSAFPRSDDPAPDSLANGVVRAADDHYEKMTGKRPGRSLVVRGLPAPLVDSADGQPLGIDKSLEALYRGELAYVDSQVGRLLDGLAQRGFLEDALVIVTADHGETMWEHADYWNHGLALHETSVHVPLIVRAPEKQLEEFAGTQVPQPVSNIDIAPTALALLGLSIPERMEGQDLTAFWRDPQRDRGPIYSEATMPFGVEESSTGWPNAQKPHAIRSGRWKYVRWNYNGHEQLFDLSKDPGERHNLLGNPASAPSRARADQLAEELAQWRASAHPFPSVYHAGRDAKMLQSLDALGYGSGEQD